MVQSSFKCFYYIVTNTKGDWRTYSVTLWLREFDIYLETVNSPGEGEALTEVVEDGGAADLDLLLRPEDWPGSDTNQVGPLWDCGWNMDQFDFGCFSQAWVLRWDCRELRALSKWLMS